jgi:hypothetical protein
MTAATRAQLKVASKVEELARDQPMIDLGQHDHNAQIESARAT